VKRNNARTIYKMRLVLSRAKPSDFDAIISVCFNVFGSVGITRAFYGYKIPESFAALKKMFSHGADNDVSDVWLKIEDLDEEMEYDIFDENGNSTGKEKRKRVVCASNWRIYPNYVKSYMTKDLPAPIGTTEEHIRILNEKFFYLDTEEERRDAAFIVYDLLERRCRAGSEPHVLCAFLFTDKEYHGKGAGRMMMQWGNNLADNLMLPCWIESSVAGEPLYAKMGYEQTDRVFYDKVIKATFCHMRRPAKVTGFEGKVLVKVP
jgi:GNAT superfamily N-acetyltransferase